MLLALRWQILWFFWILVIVLTTTLPWHNFQGVSHWDMVWIPFQDASFSLRFFIDLIGNIMLYVPFGYLYVRSRPTLTMGVFVWALLLASLLSVGTEIVQVFSQYRVPTITDVFSNIMGASFGVALVIVMSKSSDGS